MRNSKNLVGSSSKNNLSVTNQAKRSPAGGGRQHNAFLRSQKSKVILGAALSAVVVSFADRSAHGQTALYWDAAPSGTGTWLNTNVWNTTNTNSAGNATWADGDQAIFSNPNVSIGTVYTVTVGTVAPDSLVFNSAAPVNFSGGTITLTPVGGTGITMNSGLGANAVKIASAVVLGNSQTWTDNSAGSLTVSGAISGSGDTLTINDTAAGDTFLNVADSFGGGLNISAGSVFLGLLGAQGSGTINLGVSGSSSNAALWVQGTGTGANGTYGNAINVLGGGTNTIGATSFNPVYGGLITLGNGSTPGNLSVVSNNTGGSTVGVTGGISGIGNLIVDVMNQATTKNSSITFSGGNINPTGTITNSGTGDTTAADSEAIFTASIGSNVTTVTQNSAISPLFLNAVNSFTGGLNISAGTVNIGTVGALSSGTVTLGTGSANASLVLNGLSNGSGAGTYPNAINVMGTGTNTLGAVSWGPTYSGAITLGNGVTGSNLTISSVNASGSTVGITGGITGIGNVITNVSSQAGTGNSNVTISGGAINPVGTLTNNGSGDAVAADAGVTISATIGSNVTTVTENSTVSPLFLNAANSFTGPLNVSAGTVNLGTVGAQSSGLITIGTTGSANAASLIINGTSTLANGTYPNNINVAGTGTDTLSVINYNPIFTGAISLADSLTISSNDAFGSTMGITGGITGTGNLTITISNEATTGNSTITLSGAAINPVGSITNNGTANNTPVDSEAVISANIGSNVTNITENSATSPLILSGSNTYTGIVTITAGILDFQNPSALYNGSTGSWTATNITVKPGATLAVGVGGANQFTAGNITTLLGLGGATNGFMNGSNIGFDTSGGNFTWSTPITNTSGGTNSLGLVKLGANTLQLSAGSTYGGSTTLYQGTLQLGVTNALPTTTNLVLAGGTLDANGNSQTITGGVTILPGSSSAVTDSVHSGGTLIINGTSDVNFGSSTPVNNTVDMSGLTNFTFNEPSNTFNVGDNGTYATAANSTATVNLGGTNNITAANFEVAGSGSNGQGIASGVLNLGQTNNIDANTIIIANLKQSGTVQFNTGLTNPIVTILGTAGTGTTANMTVGLGNNFGAATYTATFNTTGGTLNAALSNLMVGEMADRFGTMTGSFIMGAGTLSVSGTMTLGQAAGATATDARNATGIFQLTGGTASASTILLANNLATNGISNASGSILLVSGSLLSTTITQGGAPPAVVGTTAGGTNSVNFTWTDGTVGNIAGTNLAISSGVPLTLTNTGNTSGTHTFDITPGQTGTINSTITGTGSISKIDGGALVLANASYSYSGSTTISGGSLAVNGSLVSSSAVNINSGGTLAGIGSVGPVTLASGGAIHPGALAADGNFGTLTVNGLTDNGGDMRFDLGGATSDFINDTSGSFDGAGGTISLALDSGLTNSTYTILTAAGGITGALPTLTTPVISRTAFALSQSGNSLVITQSGTTANLTWDDIGTGNGTTWDAVQSNQNWNNSGGADTFFNADNVTFNDINAGHTTVSIVGQVLPGSMTFSNNSSNYTITGSGGIGGVTGLLINGTGSVTLLTSNTFTGDTNISSGTLILGTGGSIADTNVNVNGGTLNVSGGTLASTNLNVNAGSALVSSGNVSSSSINISAGSLSISPAGSLTGAGVLVTVASGASFSAASGATLPATLNLVDNGTTTFSNPATTIATLNGTGLLNLNGDILTVTGGGTMAGTIADGSSPGGLSVPSSTLILLGSNTYSGATNVSAGAILEIGNGGSSGSLNPSSFITNNGSLLYNLNSDSIVGNSIANKGTLSFTSGGSSFFVNGTITGTGPMVENGANLVISGNLSGYSGAINLSNGALTFNYAIGATTTIVSPINIIGGTTITNTSKLILSGVETLGTQTLIFNLASVAGTLSDGVPADVEITGSVNRTSGNGLIINGPGTLALSGTTDNAALGATLDSGTLLLNKTSNANVHAIGGAPLNIANGASVQITGTGGDQIFNGSGGGTVTVSGTFDLNGNSEAINALTIAGGTVANTLNNSTSVLTIGFTPTSGIFQVTGGQGNLYAASGATLAINGTGPGQAPGASQILNITGPGTVLLTGTTDNVNMTANVTDGTLVLAKTNSSTGAHAVNTITNVNFGAEVQLGAGGSGSDQIYDGFSGGNTVDWGVLNMDGTFDTNGQSEGFDKLTGTGNVINSQTSTSTLTLGTNNLIGPTVPVFSGTISGNIALVLNASTGTTTPMTLSGLNSYTAGTNVAGGTLVFAAPYAFPNFTSLTVGAGGFAAASNHSTGLTGSAKNNLFASSLTLAGNSVTGWTGTLDLGNNDMVVQNGNLAQITSQVAQGYNNGTWTNTGGIMSSAAAADSTHLTALGVILNSSNGSTGGTVLYTSFDGATAAATTDVLIKYTYYGDTDLNGEVDGSDYSRIDSAFLYNETHPGSPMTGWFNGDFNYDGVINGSDYTLIDNAFNSQGSQIAAEIATPTAQIAGDSGASGVPEPTTLGLLGIGAVGLLGRRRRRC